MKTDKERTRTKERSNNKKTDDRRLTDCRQTERQSQHSVFRLCVFVSNTHMHRYVCVCVYASLFVCVCALCAAATRFTHSFDATTSSSFFCD